MNPPKVFWAAAVFALVVIGAGFFILQSTGFAQAQGKITGTIVLTDKSTAEEVYTTGSVALPGSTCDVVIVQCGSTIGDVYDSYVPAFYKSTLKERQGNAWPMDWQNDSFTEFIPLSQPLGVHMTVDDKCNGSEYRGLSSGNYIIGQVMIRHNGEYILYPTPPKYPNQGSEISMLTVSYSCT
ncbi:MAG: hypothetical protein HY392_00530 [Candidatus Diapherotrites archaeon]|nr:hypothetical protein [Candidatus Diapherotrites archaeon]